MTPHVYQDSYYDYIDTGSSQSAKHVLNHVLGFLEIRSVLDVGCGRGAWLAEWSKAGACSVHGIDGPYVQTEKLPFPAENFTPANLSTPIDLKQKFDLVQSLEVAEHIAEEFADIFIDNLTRHGDVILFSAATPGQGGEDHINEQPLDYWRGKFEAREYIAYDAVRPAIKDNSEIEAWYRYNTIIYVKKGNAAEGLIPVEAIEKGTPIEDVSPLTWRIRNKSLSLLSQQSIDRLAKIKHILHRNLARLKNNAPKRAS